MKTTTICLVLCLFVCFSVDAQRTSANGFWEQLGYGKLMEIQDDSVRIYDICNAGCTLYDEKLLAEIGKVASFKTDSLVIQKNVKTYKYARIESMPIACTKPNRPSSDPHYNFDILWHSYNENYCYFDQRNINWDSIYQTYQTKITKETSDVELFQLLDTLLSSLNDGHAKLYTPDDISEKLKTAKNQEEEDPINSLDLEMKTSQMIANHYCQNVSSHNAGFAKWGMMEDTIGYIQINAMLFLAYYDIEPGLGFYDWYPLYAEIANNKVFQRQDEIDGSKKLMKTIMTDLVDAKSYILDLRFNFGGKDEVALEIIGHFIDKQMLVATKKAKLGNGFTNHQNIKINPVLPSFTGDVYVLTSHQTASAAEIACMATIEPINMTRIGSPTEGIFSDQLEKRLPIGWEYTLSNEIYQDKHGNSYENIGIPPDVLIKYPKDKIAFSQLLQDQLSSSGDEAIEIAIERQKEKK